MGPEAKNETAEVVTAYSPGNGLFRPQDRSIWSTHKATPELPQVSAQHIEVNQFRFWFILICQAENQRFRSSFLIWSNATFSGAAVASVRRVLCATGVITDLALCLMLVSFYMSVRTFSFCTYTQNYWIFTFWYS